MTQIKKNMIPVIVILFISFLLSACGPSPEDLEATSAAQTAAAVTPTTPRNSCPYHT